MVSGGKALLRSPPGRAPPAEAAPAAAARRVPAFSPAGMQRRFGNQGAGALLARLSEGGAAAPVRAPSGGGCCDSRRLQAKLTVGPAHDRLEREADIVADRVMRMDGGQVAEGGHISRQSADSAVQRLCHECEDDRHSQPAKGHEKNGASEEQELVRRQVDGARSAQPLDPQTAESIQAVRGGGQSLPAEERAFFEPRFGRDFGNVRIHADASAARAAGAIGARAFTIGNDVAFGAGQYRPGSREGRRLLAHELTHVVQQGAATSRVTGMIQRAGDPAAIPPDLACPTDLTPGAPAGTDLRFTLKDSVVSAAHTAELILFRTSWLASGGADNIIVHGYASTDGKQATNWTLSCSRALAIQAELIRLGIPAVRISVLAHGASNDFGASAAANRHVVVASRAPGIIRLPVVRGTLTAADNFVGRSATRFGVGEVINLGFVSFPLRPAADFGGLEWNLAAGTGTLTGVTNVGTGVYTAPAAAAAVRLELRVAGGATAGRVISSHPITIVEPASVRMVAVPGTAPTFSPGGLIAVGTWGAGFQANVFLNPRDVSFQGVVFGEGTVPSVISGSFLTPLAGPHGVNTFGPAHGGNAGTGTPVSPPADNIFSGGRGPVATIPIVGPLCGAGDFLWAIPWEFSVAGGPRRRFPGGFTANHHATSTVGCNATIEKAGSGRFCRRIDGTTC